MQTLRELLAELYGGQPSDHEEPGRRILRWLQEWLSSLKSRENFRWRFELNPWEVSRNRFKTDFVQWIADRQRDDKSTLPPLTMAKQMLLNSQRDGTQLARNLWEEFEATQKKSQESPAIAPGSVPWDTTSNASPPEVIDSDQARVNRDRVRQMLQDRGIET